MRDPRVSDSLASGGAAVLQQGVVEHRLGAQLLRHGVLVLKRLQAYVVRYIDAAVAGLPVEERPWFHAWYLPFCEPARLCVRSSPGDGLDPFWAGAQISGSHHPLTKCILTLNHPSRFNQSRWSIGRSAVCAHLDRKMGTSIENRAADHDPKLFVFCRMSDGRN
jgi:hypothetical protein